MKRICLGLFLLLCETMALGQTIQRITLEMQKDNEPPTIPGPALYRIDFQKSATGDFIATRYFENRKKRNLATQVVLEKDRVATVFQWIQQNQQRFPLAAMGITHAELVAQSKEKNYYLSFDIPDDSLIRVDSFTFCQNYRFRYTISNGGTGLGYSFTDELGKKTSFWLNTYNFGSKEFNLQHYLFGYFLLNGKVPEELSKFDLFTKSMASKALLNYFQILECEGYYKEEFWKEESAKKDSKKRWNFVEYMKQRK